MKTNKFLLGLLLVLIIPSVFAISVSPQSFSTVITAGGSQQSKTFTFTNLDNLSKSISFTTTGDNPSLISLSNNSLVFAPNSTQTLIVTTNVLGSTPEGIYVNYIAYDGSSIPIILTVQANQQQGGCQLTPSVSAYIIRIQTSAKPFTKKFSAMVSPACSGYLNIATPITIGTVYGSDNIEKPISLSGELSVGQKLPGQSAEFEVEFDISGLETGVYTPYIIINSFSSNGTRYQTKIEFTITALSSISPATNLTSLPTYTIPSSIKVNEAFEVSARNVDPNLQPIVLPMYGVTGLSTTLSQDGTWVWKGITNRTGILSLSIVTLMKGSMVGEIKTYNITITGAGSLPSSQFMQIDFNPPLGSIQDNSTVAVLCRDASSKNIVSCTLYKNGIVMDSNTIVVHIGESYIISATNPNYNTNDTLLLVNLIPIVITLPDKILNGIPFQILSNPENITLIIDDVINNNKNSVIIPTVGNHTIKVVAEGYADTTQIVNVLQSLKITNFPADLSDKNKNGLPELGRGEYTFGFNTNETIDVYFTEKDSQTKEIIATGLGSVTFKTKGAGTYELIGEGRSLGVYEVASKNITKTIIWIIIIVVVVILFLFILKGKGGDRPEMYSGG